LFAIVTKLSRSTAALVDEFDAGRLKCPSEHSDRLRPHAKPVSYRFFLGALAAGALAKAQIELANPAPGKSNKF
jgi:hypothetical protein